ncbi:MAG TPA: glycerophosphodiester phosphodiesterase [Candidatus Binataceae bacterium]
MRPEIDTDFFSLPLPRAFAHRGSAGTHPENTIVSFKAAADAGIQYFELDVHMTRDGEVVVSHDEGLMRLCGRSGLIRELTLEEVQAADAAYSFSLDGIGTPFRGKGIRMPRLADVFESFPQIRVIIEIKQTAPSLVAPLVKLIDRHGMRRRVMIASEHQMPLAETRALAPDIPTNFAYPEVSDFLQAMAAKDASYRPPGDALQIPTEYESWKLINRDSIAFAHHAGLELHAWTINDEREMNELLDMGVDGIISDFPARLLRVIASRRLIRS